MDRVVIVGPTSMTWAEIADSVDDDLRHLRRPGLEISYVTTGAGPASIRSPEDEAAAAPHVVATVRRVAESCDAVVVDCTGDPGVAAARAAVSVPVVGAGEAVRRAAAQAPTPVAFLSGDTVRRTPLPDLEEAIAGAATIAVEATGQRELVTALRSRGDVTVLEPLETAVDRCLELLDRTR